MAQLMNLYSDWEREKNGDEVNELLIKRQLWERESIERTRRVLSLPPYNDIQFTGSDGIYAETYWRSMISRLLSKGESEGERVGAKRKKSWYLDLKFFFQIVFLFEGRSTL